MKRERTLTNRDAALQNQFIPLTVVHFLCLEKSLLLPYTDAAFDNSSYVTYLVVIQLCNKVSKYMCWKSKFIKIYHSLMRYIMPKPSRACQTNIPFQGNGIQYV